MSAREPEWTERVYRVRIDHLLNDSSGAYLERCYGPYTTERAAKSQLTRLLKDARTDYRKANGWVENSYLDWKAAA